MEKDNKFLTFFSWFPPVVVAFPSGLGVAVGHAAGSRAEAIIGERDVPLGGAGGVVAQADLTPRSAEIRGTRTGRAAAAVKSVERGRRFEMRLFKSHTIL